MKVQGNKFYVDGEDIDKDELRLPELTEKISAVLSGADLKGLVKMGAPPQEYNFEADLIARRILDGQKVDADMLIDIFEYTFKSNIKNVKPYETAAQEISKSIKIN